MEYRQLGRSGLKVASLCLGTNVFGWTADEADSFKVLDVYAGAGGNFLDSADAYSRWAPGNHGGESETIIGKWLAERGGRDRMIVATKVGSPMGEGPMDRGLSRQHIMEGAEASLRRLQTDYIDLYWVHNDAPEIRPEESLRAFDDLVSQGKVRYIGASNVAPWRIVAGLWASDRHGWARYECLQPEYNLVDRERFEREYQPLAREYQLGVVPYYGLAAGFLSGKYQRGHELPDSARAQGVQRRYLNDRGYAIVDELVRVADEQAHTPAQTALAWLMAQPTITAAIASARTVEQARELVAAAELRLSTEALAALSAAGGAVR